MIYFTNVAISTWGKAVKDARILLNDALISSWEQVKDSRVRADSRVDRCYVERDEVRYKLQEKAAIE
jgi:hypothetical protein